MSPEPFRPGSVRSADAVNAAIRAVVWGARDREWTQAERALYELLVAEWLAALQAEMATAA